MGMNDVTSIYTMEQEQSLGYGIVPDRMDVLCGKDKQCIHHFGTKQYKLLIESHKERYSKALTKYDKMTITKELYDIVRQQLGRFLKYNEETKLWEELDMMMARDKIGHSLRFANRRKGGSRKDRLYRKSSASIPSFSSSASSSVISAGADTATTSASTSASVSSSENSIYTASESNQTSYSWLPLNNQGEYEPTPLEDMLGKSIGDLAHSLDTVLLSDLFAPQQQADASSTNISNSKSSSNGNNDNRNNNSGSLMDLFLKSNQSDCRHSCNGYNNDNFLSSTSNHKEEEEEEEELFSPSLLWD